MKKIFSASLITCLLLTACGKEEPVQYSYSLVDIFPEISVSEEHNLYVDETGQPAQGHYLTTYPDGSVRADVTFRDGMIINGDILRPNGNTFIGYTMDRNLMVMTNYRDESQPRIITKYGEDLSDRREFHVWTEDGTRIVESDESIFKLWFESGQLSMVVPSLNGNTHGIIRSWYENGQPQSEYHFTEGVRDGPSIDWDEEGNVVKNETYENGELISEGQSG
ncbi:MAG: toxin-antitoxin system YwqK family antitoxin [Balneolaceae bacterium]